MLLCSLFRVLLCALCTALDSAFLQVDTKDGQADLSVCWAHIIRWIFLILWLIHVYILVGINMLAEMNLYTQVSV